MSKRNAEAEAVAIAEDRVVAVGKRATVEAFVGPKTEIIDLEGRVVLPGFIDAHAHLTNWAAQVHQTDLSGTRSARDALDILRKTARATPAGSWVLAHSFDESRWKEKRVPTREDLDTVSADHPMVLKRVCGHLAVVNTRAIEELDIPLGSPDVEVDERGKRTGVLRESVAERVLRSVQPPDAQALEELETAIGKAHALGITGFHVTADARDLRLYRMARARGKAPIRITAYLRSELLPHLAKLGFGAGFGDEWLRVGGVKVYSDGSIGARTAAVSAPYVDDPLVNGVLVHRPDELRSIVSQAHEAGLQVAVHAIGDRAIGAVLDAFEGAWRGGGSMKDARHRIEHFELATDEHLDRARKMNLIASMQPNFVGEWGMPGGMYEERLGKDAVQRHNRLHRVLGGGIHLVFGSDHMPTGPLYGIACAANGPTPDQCIPVEDALAAYTAGPAFASFEERVKGSLEKGKYADIVVLSEDPRRAKNLRDVVVELTILGGKIVYRNLQKRGNAKSAKKAKAANAKTAKVATTKTARKTKRTR